MATFRVEIRTDNEAFENHPHQALSILLGKLAEDVGRYGATVAAFILKDVNGNTVGKATWK